MTMNFFTFFSCFLLCSFSLFEPCCDQLLNILEHAADQGYIGEPVSQLEHALQCAHLATTSGADDETVLAALFHDIGHLCEERGEYGVIDHAAIGADFLRLKGMSEKVCQLVLGHVEAKRYLTAVDADYYSQLSEASKITLALQGGPMSAEEVQNFEKDPLFDLKIKMRYWDEQAKIPNLSVPDLSFYRPLLIAHLNNKK